ncbi:MAG: Jag N-terminal domain-containing protein [Deltaproteobacteria bacterium]|nr:Jag N-terminal domain-containing protein [Deltaproteobacteria bacterium]
MSCVEAEGTSIDEAIEQALDSLGVGREQVSVDILVSPTKGVLGFGSRKAKVRVRVRQPVDAEADAGAERPSPALPPAVRAAPGAPVPSAPSAATDPEAAPARAQSTGGGNGDEAGESDPELLARAQALLQEVLEHMGFGVSVSGVWHDGTVELTIAGDSSGVLIGRHGQTLDALEYFLHRALSRDEGGRIAVDSEGYRARRRETLEAMASRLAQQAKIRRKPMAMENLSPRDRRVVHMALQNEPGLTTRSSGDGYYRKLLIIPESRSARTGTRGGNQ